MQRYNAPNGSPSSVGTQFDTFYHDKTALIEAKKDMYFMPLADVKSMPKHFGKEIKVYHYIPLLDDRNINDQGIDAAGAVINSALHYVTFDDLTYSFAVQADADAVVSAVNAIEAGVAVRSGAGPWVVTMSKDKLVGGTKAQVDAVRARLPRVQVRQGSGNLYGSSKDVGTITGKLPTLTEVGGRVNRVGFTRLERSGRIQKFGFFQEFTQESFDFDTDEDLYSHLSREMLTGATQLTEAVLQVDLLLAAGTVLYAGAATNNATMTAEGGVPSVVDYDDLMRLSIMLDDNRTPKQTQVITGSRMIDTKTIAGGRIMYIGSELEMLVTKMVDPFGDQAFIPVHKYASGGTLLNGEIGSIDKFRLVVVPEMLRWENAGGAVGANPGYRSTGDNYDIFPMLVIGAESFTTIGFQTDGKTTKFKITTKMPGENTADRTDPYGETGFSSIKWYYGFMSLRPERIALIKTLAPQ